jgi:hypothetical protein
MGALRGFPTALNVLFRVSGRGVLDNASIRGRLGYAHKTMHRMVLSPLKGVAEDGANHCGGYPAMV